MLRLIALTLLAVLLPLTAPYDLGAAGADAVEEDWELVLATPDPDVTSPQITTSMQLDSSVELPTMNFILNYRDTPAFAAGGVQVKMTAGGSTTAASKGSEQLQTPDETVTWTQRLSLNGGAVTFEVVSGKSTTWGDFGAGTLSVGASTGVGSLAGYDPAVSVSKSSPTFGANRVARMTLLRVRYYRDHMLLSTDATPRPIELPN